MFVVQWINFVSRKLSPQVPASIIRARLNSYNLPANALEQLTASIKTEAELQKVVTQASCAFWEERMIKLCDDVNAWFAATNISGNLLIAAQWVVGRSCLHPCFGQRDWLTQRSAKDFDFVWKDISNHSGAESLKISPTKTGFDVTFGRKSKLMDFSNPLFRNELQFWLLFCNVVIVWRLKELGSNGTGIHFAGSLSAWLDLAKYLEVLQSQ